MSKTFGQLVHGSGQDGNRWGIRARPFVATTLKRIFIRADATHPGVVLLSDTPSVARDIEWVMQRYPLEADPAVLGYLHQRADEARRTEEAVHSILSGYTPPDRHRETAVKPRDYQLQADAVVHATGRCLIADDLGLGKAQPLDALVLTPSGFRPMGEIKPGDLVITGVGSPTRVTAVFPQGDQDCYQVSFSDGATVECNDEHLWWVRRQRRNRSKITGELLPFYWQAKTLRQLIDSGLRIKDYGNGEQAKWHIPMAAAIDLDQGDERPLDPYLLGVLLGDGGFTGTSTVLTTADPDILAAVEAAVPPGIVMKRINQYDYRLTSVTNSQKNNLTCPCGRDARYRGLCGRCYQAMQKAGTPLPPLAGKGEHPISTPLERLGLRGHTSLTKFVPNAYKMSPVACRLAILQGLMDTDGYAMPLRRSGSATAQFYSSSQQLADDVRWLVESLGGTGRTTSKFAAGRMRYAVTVKLPQPLNPFRLSRKAKVWGDGHTTLAPTRAITHAEFIGRKPMQCIAVEHPSRLYVTDRFIVTHNTLSSCLRLRDPEALPAAVVVPAQLPGQWQDRIGEYLPWLRTHVVARRDVYDPADRCGGRDPDVLILSYRKLADWGDYLAGRVRTVIFDEAQDLRTGYGTAKYAAACNVASKADYRTLLTATPVYNYGDEIWNLLHVIDPDALGTQDEFRREWCAAAEGMNKHPLVKNPAELGEFLRDSGIMLVRTRKQTRRELPEPVQIEQSVDTDHAGIDQVAADVAEHARLLVTGQGTWKDRGQAALDLDWRMRQATGIAKAPYVAEFCRLLLETEERIVLCGWHRDVYSAWLDKLADYNPVMYTGTETPARKQASVDAFTQGKSRVLIMSLRSGAGLDGLQKHCSVMVFGELDWSPMVHAQCLGRLNRDGQESAVIAYYMISDDGTDPLMCDTLGIKRQQSLPLRDPSIPVYARLTPESERSRKLAATVLERVGAKGRAR